MVSVNYSAAVMSGSVGSLVMKNGYTVARQERTVSRFREILPQVLATCASNMVMLNLTLTLSFSTIVIAALHHAEDELSLDDTQASWFGSLLFICQPLGSVASGVIVDVLGRKRSLILINLPYLLSCILIATANSVPMLFCANVLIGITIGLTEAPMNSYFGEICQPELRGILASCAALYYQLGILLEYTMGSLLHWRTAAALSAAFPSMGIILIFLVPESPIWLVAKNREKDAEKALCWLRGWVAPEAVSQELHELTRYHKEMTLKQHEPVPLQTMKSSQPELLGLLPTDIQGNKFQQEQKSSVVSRVLETLREVLKPPTRRPLVLIFFMFFFVGFSGMVSIRPFLVEVFDHFHAGMDSKWATVVTAAGGLTGSVILVTCMSLVGKRPLALISTALCGLCCIGLGAYAIVMEGREEYTTTWVPVLLIVLLSLGNMVQSHIPWLLVCETFPYRTRGIAGGVGAASCYVVWFTATRTYLRMEHSLELHGAFWVFGAISVIGFIFMYFRLPETEGKTLEDIERYFSR